MRWTSSEEVGRMLFSPSGLLLATTRCCGDDSEKDALRLWDALSGEELAQLVRIGPVFSLSFATERTLFIVQDRGCRLWDSASGEVRDLRKTTSCNGGIVSADGKSVVVSLREGGMVVLDLASGKLLHRLRPPLEYEAWYDNFAVAGPYLATACTHRYAGGALLLWDLERGKRLRSFDIGREAWPLAIHPRGHLLALAEDRAVLAYGIDAEEELEGFRPFQCEHCAHDLRYVGDGALQVLDKGRLVRLDETTGKVLSRRKIPSALDWHRGAIDPAGEKVAVAADREIEVLDLLDA